MIVALIRLGTALRDKGDLEESLESFQQALRLSEEIAARHPETVNYRRALIARHQNIGRLLGDPDELNLGRPAEAIAHYRKAFALAQEFSTKDPHNVQDKREVAMAALFVAMMLRDSQPAEAAELYRQSKRIAEPLCQAAPENVEFRQTLALANRGLAYTDWRLGKPNDALPVLRQALESQLVNYTNDPTRTWSHRNLSRTYQVIGNLLLEQGDREGAREQYQQALTLAQKLLAIHPLDPILQRDEAYAFENFGRFHTALATDTKLPRADRRAAAQEAITWYQRSRAVWDKWLATDVAKPYATSHRTQAARALEQCEALLARLGTP